MRWIELEIVVPAPPAEAFPWVVEPGLLKEWMPQLEELRPRGFLHHAPVVRHGALQLALDVRVHRVVVPELLELDITWRGAIARLHLEVEAHPDGATVTWRTGLELPPALRLAGPGVARELRRIMRRDLELLAECLGESHDVGESPDDASEAGDPPSDPGSRVPAVAPEGAHGDGEEALADAVEPSDAPAPGAGEDPSGDRSGRTAAGEPDPRVT